MVRHPAPPEVFDVDITVVAQDFRSFDLDACPINTTYGVPGSARLCGRDRVPSYRGGCHVSDFNAHSQIRAVFYPWAEGASMTPHGIA